MYICFGEHGARLSWTSGSWRLWARSSPSSCSPSSIPLSFCLQRPFSQDSAQEGSVLPPTTESSGRCSLRIISWSQRRKGDGMPSWIQLLNKFICQFRCSVVNLAFIIPTLAPQNWLVALHLLDAFFYIANHPTHRKYLRFLVGKSHYQYKVLPFSLSIAPKLFIKCLAVAAAHLGRQGIQVYLYLHDRLRQNQI